MGYARLYFPNDATVAAANIIQDIAGVLTGTITSVANLRASTDTRTLSTIVNTENSNWTLRFPTAINFNATPTATNTSIILSSSCVDANKTKFIRLGMMSLPTNGSPALPAAGGFFYASAGGAAAVVLQACTNATSTTALTNQTSINNKDTSPGDTFGAPHFGGNYITLRWNQRHCFMYGFRSTAAAGRRIVMASFEHNEIPTSQWANVAPVSYLLLDSVTTANGISYTGTYSGTGVENLGNQATLHSYLTELNHYNTSAQVSTGVYNPMSDATTFALRSDFTLTSNASANYPTVVTKTSTGSTAMYMQPLFYHQHHIGIPHLYFSNLSGIYRVAANIGSEGDLITIGSDTYVYLPFNNAFAFAVKRA